MPTPKKPSKKLIADTEKVTAAHAWPAVAFIAPKPASASARIAMVCPVGTSPQEITYKDASGAWVTRTVCL